MSNDSPRAQISTTLLWMLVDGVGLGLIAGCTILEGRDLWTDYFQEHYAANLSSVAFWCSGRSCQVMGLILLIAHAASLQILPEIETAGMTLLTAGPLLNIVACSFFTSDTAELHFCKQWMLTEIIELVGISILDLSLLNMEHIFVLTAEVVGFAILACAALLDFDFSVFDGSGWIGTRLDPVHVFDCLGLLLLTIVAVAQYHIKESKHHKK